MPEKIMVARETGEIGEAELLSFFDLEETGGKYIIYTFNETDANGLVKLHVGRVREENSTYIVSKIEDDNEWNQVKTAMKQMITGGN